MRRLVVGLAIISLAALALSWAQADDQEIAKEITARLKQEQKVGHLRDFDINLKVADGNVLLKGHVTSPEQQQLALETARSAKGVKHVVSDLQITPAAPASEVTKATADSPAAEASADSSPVSDAQIGEQLSAELKRRKDVGELKGFGLGISVNKGVVVLRGRVSSAEQLQLALDAAKQTAGVRDVVSHVVVVAEMASLDNAPSSEATSPVAGKERADEEISRQIALAVKAEKAAGKLSGFDIDLEVENGVATFTGQVPTAEQMKLAVELARKTPGVRDVVNKLVIVPAIPQAKELAAEPQAVAASPAKVAAPTDAEISRSLATALKEQKSAGKFKGFDLNLAVREGIVTYTGRVVTQEQLQLALDLARQTAGVREVVNQLTIAEAPSRTLPAETAVAKAPPAAPSDGDIAQRIAASLKEQQAAGHLKGFDIDVTVKDGIVKYTGHVANAGQLQTALAIAQQTDGVQHIVNQLVVTEATPPTPRVALLEAVAERPTQTVARPVALERTETPAPEKTAAQPIVSASYHSERSDTPTPAMDYATEDRRIGEELTAGLDEAKRTGNLRGFGISVGVEHSNVLLQGRVSSAEQRQLALDLARSIPGVGQVTDDLSVAAPAPEPVAARPNHGPEVARKAPANEIARVLNARLRSEESQGRLQGSHLKIQVVGSQVTLQGQVTDSDQRKLAVETAKNVPGVEKVVDSLTERPVNMVIQTAYPYGYAPYPSAANGNEPAPTPAPRPLGAVQTAAYVGAGVVAAPFMAISQVAEGSPIPAHLPSPGAAQVPARYDHPNLPGYAWPSYAAYPNYAAVTYPKQYSPTAWPYIGPFYPYPQVPLGWRKVTLKWDDGWWQLNFKSK